MGTGSTRTARVPLEACFWTLASDRLHKMLVVGGGGEMEILAVAKFAYCALVNWGPSSSQKSMCSLQAMYPTQKGLPLMGTKWSH